MDGRGSPPASPARQAERRKPGSPAPPTSPSRPRPSDLSYHQNVASAVALHRETTQAADALSRYLVQGTSPGDGPKMECRNEMPEPLRAKLRELRSLIDEVLRWQTPLVDSFVCNRSRSTGLDRWLVQYHTAIYHTGGTVLGTGNLQRCDSHHAHTHLSLKSHLQPLGCKLHPPYWATAIPRCHIMQ